MNRSGKVATIVYYVLCWVIKHIYTWRSIQEAKTENMLRIGNHVFVTSIVRRTQYYTLEKSLDGNFVLYFYHLIFFSFHSVSFFTFISKNKMHNSRNPSNSLLGLFVIFTIKRFTHGITFYSYASSSYFRVLYVFCLVWVDEWMNDENEYIYHSHHQKKAQQHMMISKKKTSFNLWNMHIWNVPEFFSSPSYSWRVEHRELVYRFDKVNIIYNVFWSHMNKRYTIYFSCISTIYLKYYFYNTFL